MKVFYEDASSPGFGLRHPLLLWQIVDCWKLGANYGLHLVCGRVGASGLFEPLHQEEPQTPSTYEVVGLLKNNKKLNT